MSHRSVVAGRGAGWINDGLEIAKANPGAFALMGLLFGLLSSIPLAGLFIGLLGPVFYGGLVSAFQRQSSGGEAQIGQLFDGFSLPGAFGRLVVIVLPSVVFGLFAVVLLLVLLGGSLVALYNSASGGGQPDPQLVMALLGPMALACLVLIPVGVLIGWLNMLAIPRAMLDGVPGFTALGEAWRAIGSNIGALLVNTLCLVALVMVLMVIGMIPLFLALAVVGAEGPLALLAQTAFGAVFGGGIALVYAGTMHSAWREIFASDVPPPIEQIAV